MSVCEHTDRFVPVFGAGRGEQAADTVNTSWRHAYRTAPDSISLLDYLRPEGQPEDAHDPPLSPAGERELERLLALAAGEQFTEPLAVIETFPLVWRRPYLAKLQITLHRQLSDCALTRWTRTLGQVAAPAGLHYQTRDGRYHADDYGRFAASTYRCCEHLFSRLRRGETCCHEISSLPCENPRTVDRFSQLADPVDFVAAHIRHGLVSSLAARNGHGAQQLAGRVLGELAAQRLDELSGGRLPHRVGGRHLAPAISKLLPARPRELSTRQLARQLDSYAREVEAAFTAFATGVDPYPDTRA